MLWSVSDLVRRDRFNNITGCWTINGLAVFSQGVKVTSETQINGIKPVDLCNSKQATTFTEPQYFSQLTLTESMNTANLFNGKVSRLNLTNQNYLFVILYISLISSI